MNLNFIPITIPGIQPLDLKVSFASLEKEISDERLITVGILKVKGHYLRGSRGAHYGEFLRGLRVFVQELYRLDTLILDLTDLEYEWGNNLAGLLEPEKWTLKEPEYWLGTFLILSKLNEKGIMSLLGTFRPQQRILKIVSHYEEALDAMH